MISGMITFSPLILFAGFGLGFFMGYLVSLIKYIIVTVQGWMKS